MNLANLDYYRENEEDFSKVLYEFRKKSYEESEDYFVFNWMWDDYIVNVALVHEVIPGEYSSVSESPDEYYDNKNLIGWAVGSVRLSGSCVHWTQEEFLDLLDKEGKMCFNSELKQFINQHA